MALADESRSSISSLMPYSLKYPFSIAISSAALEVERAMPMRIVVSSARTAPVKAIRAPMQVSTLRADVAMQILPASSLLPRTLRGAGLACNEVAAFVVAIDRQRVAQGFEVPHDPAAVAAAHRTQQPREEFCPVLQRRPNRGEAPAGKARRRGNARLDPLAGAERPGEIEPRLAAHAGARCQRWVERQRA